MSSRSAIFSKSYPGYPVNLIDVLQVPNDAIFVYGSTGVNSVGRGHSPDKPVKTLDYAVGLCAASKVDTIILMPGHAETVVSATGCVIDIAGVQIIGLGSGALIPTITLGTADTATISVTAANVRMKNVKVISNLVNMAVGVTLDAAADGFTAEDCWFTDGSLTTELVIAISVGAGCNYVMITNCRFVTDISAETGACASAIKFVGASTGSRIIHNFFCGNWSTAVIDGADAAMIGVYIEDNHILQIDTAAALAISLNAGTTGIVVRNLICNLKDTAVPVVAAACCVAENYGSNAAGASGIIKPGVDS